jgi:N-methylhydantoinase A/oxoprolinase/acetone carboxylase beta subunit
VVTQFSEQVATEVINKVLEDEVGRPDWGRERIGQALLRRAIAGADERVGDDASHHGDLACAFTLRRPLVAIGAPVAAYLPRAAGILRTELVIPEHSGVANAVGAVSGSIIQRATVVVNPIGGEGQVRVHGLPAGPVDFEAVEPAVRHAEQMMADCLTALAQDAGAEHVEFSCRREDLRVPVNGAPDQEMFLGSTLRFTAAGRPRPARAVGS